MGGGKQQGSAQAHARLRNQILSTFGRQAWCRLWPQPTGVAVTPDGRGVVRYGLPGAADLSGILEDGRRLEIEIKSGRARQSQRQRAFQTMIERFGGVYVLARSVDDVWSVLRPIARDGGWES